MSNAVQLDTDHSRQATVVAVARGLSAEMYPERAQGIGRLGPSALLEEDFGFDSLSRAELLSRLEQMLEVTFPDAAMTQAATLEDLLRTLDESTAGGRVAIAAHRAHEPTNEHVERSVALESHTLVGASVTLDAKAGRWRKPRRILWAIAPNTPSR